MCKLCLNCEEKEAFKFSPYSNGKFCSRECSRAFSTKNNRKEISKKVSKTLTGSGNDKVTKECPTCKKTFTLKFSKRFREFCSPKCSNNDTTVKDKISKRMKGIKNGDTPSTKEELFLRAEIRRKEQTKKVDKGLFKNN